MKNITITALPASIIMVFLPNIVFSILNNFGIGTSSIDAGWVLVYFVLAPAILGLAIYLYFRKRSVNGKNLILMSIITPILIYIFLILYILPQINIGPNL